MQRNILFTTALCCLAWLSAPAHAADAAAKPELKVDMVVEKEIKVDEGGKTVTRRVKADDPRANDNPVLIYTIRYSNVSQVAATGVAVVDNIPQHTIYVANSATGANSDIRFSVDGGKTFKKADDLMVSHKVGDKTEMTKAQPADYTTIQWNLAQIGPGQTVEVGFRASVQ